MKLVFRQGNVVRGEQEFAGDLVWLPPGLLVSHKSDGEAVVESTAEGPDVLVGRIDFVFRTDTGTVRVGSLNVKPPAPFLEDDVDVMWSSVLASVIPLAELNDYQGSAQAGELGNFNHSALIWMLEQVNAACLQILREWPQMESVESVWRPTGVVAGIEDLRETERGGSRFSPISVETGQRLPSMTARRVHASEDWSCHALSSASAELMRLMMRMSVDDDFNFESVTHPLREVAWRAKPKNPVPDPPASSWPRSGRELFSLVRAALLGFGPDSSGATGPPMMDLWRLYETWLSVEVLEELSRLFGEPGRVDVAEAKFQAFCWRPDQGGRVHLIVEPSIEGSTDLGGILHTDIYSCLGVLKPDVLLVITPLKSEAPQALVALDAKKRGVSGLTASELAEYGGKYIWNLRQAWGTNERTVQRVVMATPGKGLGVEYGESRLGSITLLPGESRAGFWKQLRPVIMKSLIDGGDYVELNDLARP